MSVEPKLRTILKSTPPKTIAKILDYSIGNLAKRNNYLFDVNRYLTYPNNVERNISFIKNICNTLFNIDFLQNRYEVYCNIPVLMDDYLFIYNVYFDLWKDNKGCNRLFIRIFIFDKTTYINCLSTNIKDGTTFICSTKEMIHLGTHINDLHTSFLISRRSNISVNNVITSKHLEKFTKDNRQLFLKYLKLRQTVDNKSFLPRTKIVSSHMLYNMIMRTRIMRL